MQRKVEDLLRKSSESSISNETQMRSDQFGPSYGLGKVSMSDASPDDGREPRDVTLADETGFGLRSLRATNGLAVRALPNGCIYSIELGQTLVNQILASPVAGGVQRIYLRRHGTEGIQFTEIVGPGARSEFSSTADRFVWRGSWQQLDYRCTCWLHPSGDGWFFHVEVENRAGGAVRCDVVMIQDVGLGARSQVRNNELFTSQYLDHTAVKHSEAGYLLMSRQNLGQTRDAHPWLMQGCLPRATGFVSEGFDFFGSACRVDGLPVALARQTIGERIRQYETGYVGVQSDGAALLPSATQTWTFFAHCLPDHPQASSAADAERLAPVRSMHADMVRALASPAQAPEAGAPASLFLRSGQDLAEDLTSTELDMLFPGQRRHEELQSGQLGSFFCGQDSRHVVLKAKERSSPRPHGHIMRAGHGYTPGSQLMSCTCYAAGVFVSQLTLGNTSLCKLLSGMRDPLGLVRSNGLRLFVRRGGTRDWKLLGVPSAFEMAVDQCRWIYKLGTDLLTVACVACDQGPAFTFEIDVKGQPLELLLSGEIAAGPSEYENPVRLSVDPSRSRLTVRPDPQSHVGRKLPNLAFTVVTSTPQAIQSIGGDELLFEDGKSRRLPYLTFQSKPTTSLRLAILASAEPDGRFEELCSRFEQPGDSRWRPPATTSEFWKDVTGEVRVALPAADVGAQIQDTLAWFARDALIHLSTPRGLEQANGGAWGVRDVCQGPVEFLLSYGHCGLVADILRNLFAQQYKNRHDWPQWYMFPPFAEIQSTHCHGDVLIWPLKALCDYLEHTDNAAILEERLPYTDEETFRPTENRETILEHVDRLLAKMRQQYLPGLSLPRFGEGDWDDSLQPADPLLRERMVSSWTTELMYQTLRRYSAALDYFGAHARAAAAAEMADNVAADFQRHLVPDGVVAGFAVFGASSGKQAEYLLHPSDQRTGLKYRLIPMTRGILSGIFSEEQAKRHLELLRQHLVYPDGARLMDRPTTYEGGTERTFRRSESAAYFGREIGLQYVHAHLRYAEALARMGQADELWRALRVVNPIAVTEIVANARPRQRNCYFSSSDAAFPDRYAASRDYGMLRSGDVATDGGWRIYSSGPGIYSSLIIRHLFGLRRHFDYLEFDPVLPRELDGATVELTQNGRRVKYEFAVRSNVCSPRRVTVNGSELSAATRAPHPYRAGGLRIPRAVFNAALNRLQNQVHIEL